MKVLIILATLFIATAHAKHCVISITNQDKASYMGLGEYSCDGSKLEEVKYKIKNRTGYQSLNFAYEKSRAESYIIGTVSEEEGVTPYSVIHSEDVTTVYLKQK